MAALAVHAPRLHQRQQGTRIRRRQQSRGNLAAAVFLSPTTRLVQHQLRECPLLLRPGLAAASTWPGTRLTPETSRSAVIRFIGARRAVARRCSPRLAMLRRILTVPPPTPRRPTITKW